MSFWLIENQTDGYRLMWKINKTLHVEKTPFQHLALVDMASCGRALILDGIVQTTVWDEYIYHEMITHIAMVTHPNPKKILVIGGGDGGVVREIIKHDTVDSVDLVEIDGAVIKYSLEFLPEISSGLISPKVNIIIDDGIKYVKRCGRKYDVVIVDSPDPVGPAVGLYSTSFYNDMYRVVADEGLLVAQTESPFFNQDIIRGSFGAIGKMFPITKIYLTCVPTYPSGLWSFVIGSKTFDPLNIQSERAKRLETRYYNSNIHLSAFGLPNFVKKLIQLKPYTDDI